MLLKEHDWLFLNEEQTTFHSGGVSTASGISVGELTVGVPAQGPHRRVTSAPPEASFGLFAQYVVLCIWTFMQLLTKRWASSVVEMWP